MSKANQYDKPFQFPAVDTMSLNQELSEPMTCTQLLFSVISPQTNFKHHNGREADRRIVVRLFVLKVTCLPHLLHTEFRLPI
jgi:hypothetical protein